MQKVHIFGKVSTLNNFFSIFYIAHVINVLGNGVTANLTAMELGCLPKDQLSHTDVFTGLNARKGYAGSNVITDVHNIDFLP